VTPSEPDEQRRGTDDGRGVLPRVVYVLAAGTVLMGTTEFMIAGLLPDIADGLQVGEARAGLLISAFAIGGRRSRRWSARSSPP
jgi:predicted MFS family arabinose efflux permease